MKCMKCGWPIPEDSVFCQYCGEKVEAGREERLETPTEVEADANARLESPVFDIPETQTEREDEPVGAASQEEPTAVETSTEDTPESEALVEDALESATPVEDMQENEMPVVERVLTPMVEPAASPSPGDPPTQVDAREAKKQRYCKRCGSPVDRKTKKCQGCGKQYFRLRRLGVGLLAVLCLALVGLNVFQYSARLDLESAIAAKERTISQQRKTVTAQSKTIRSLTNDVDKYRPKVRFMDNYVVIIGDSNNKYHKYGCEDLDTSSFWIYNTETAKALGYRACKKCIQ